MRIVPDSTVSLYAGVEIDNGEQLAFSSKANQTAYFQNKLVRQAVNCTMVRKTGMLKLDCPGSVVSGCNYISFINPSFDNKIVYARIVDYDYVNNECTEILYAIDYWQTWMFDVEFDACYIEREHLSETDFQKAEINPYDPSILEFRTAETLPISKDLEKLTYNIGDGSGQGEDGVRATRAMVGSTTADDTIGVLIKFNHIDLAKLDDGMTGTPSNYPSLLLSKYLESIIAKDMGFFHITEDMYQYLHSMHQAYPTIYTFNITSPYQINTTGWQYDGTTVYPYKSSKYNPGCCVVYDTDGGEESTNNGNMSDFLNMMTKWSNVDQIIDMSIIPNNIMILAGVTAYTTNKTFEIRMGVPDLDVISKKLYRYPFSYLRTVLPNGDVKEYQFERFAEILSDGLTGKADLALTLDITDRPVLIIAPRGYKYTGMSNSYGMDTNILEAIYFDQFPTMPYTIDAFTAQCAAVANATIANKTMDNASVLAEESTNYTKTGKALATAGTVSYGGTGGFESKPPTPGKDEEINKGSFYANGTAGLATTTTTSAITTANAGYRLGSSLQEQERRFNLASERWYGAGTALGDADSNVIAQQLSLSKAAYACDKYFTSNGIGVTNFSLLGFCDLIALKVKLDQRIIDIYDYYFALYGYSSGRSGLPRVCNYVNGSSSPADTPHWVNIDNRDITYIKTMDCKIKYSMIPVASYIKNMFDSGIRMIKGD